MDNVVHRLSLDLTAADAFPRVEVQRDNARTLEIALPQGGRPYRIAEGVTAVFSARKSDGNPLFNDCTVEKNRVVYHFTDQTTNVPGIVECEILLYSGDKRILASPHFELYVDDLIHQEGDVPESAPELNALTQMVAAGTAMIEDLKEALGGLDGAAEILTRVQEAADVAQDAAELAAASETAAARSAVEAEAAAKEAKQAAASGGVKAEVGVVDGIQVVTAAAGAVTVTIVDGIQTVV